MAVLLVRVGQRVGLAPLRRDDPEAARRRIVRLEHVGLDVQEPAAIGGKLGVRDPVESEEILDLEVARGRLRGGRGQGNGEQERHGN